MPNRSPVELTLAESSTLLSELPLMEQEDAEDDDDRRRIRLLTKLRTTIEAHRASLSAAPSEARAALVLSIEEADECLDCLAPEPRFEAVRGRLTEARVKMLGGEGA